MESNDKAIVAIFCTLFVCVAVIFCIYFIKETLETEQAIKAGLQQKKVGADVVWVSPDCIFENDIKSLTD